MAQLSPLCSKCQALLVLLSTFEGKLATYDNDSDDSEDLENDQTVKYIRHHSVPDLAAAATAGCHLCVLIEDIIIANTKVPQQDDVVSAAIRYDGGSSSSPGALMLMISTGYLHCSFNLAIKSSEDARPGSNPSLQEGCVVAPSIEVPTAPNEPQTSSRVFGFEDGLKPDLRKNPLLQPTTRESPQTPSGGDIRSRNVATPILTTITSWLGKCDNKHAACHDRRNRPRRRLPARLIDVSRVYSHGECHLVETVDFPSNTKYTTLSHCWGGLVPVKLMRANYNDFLSGWNLNVLPRTFADAARITCDLRIRFLWIDSLCIIQDSREDWAAQCMQMSDIYDGSYVTLSANASSNAHGGMLRDLDARRALAVQPVRAKITFSPWQWNDREALLQPVGMPEVIFGHDTLASRGWCVQERLLSPRTIRFFRNKIAWECVEHMAIDLDPFNSNATLRTFDEKWAWVLAEQADQWGHDYTCLRKWLTVVETYNVAQLTVESDKLAAIAGLAKYLQDDLWKLQTLEYYAGLWSFDFVAQLLWGTGSDSQRCDAYTAPSWSWAAINGRITWTNMTYDTNHYLIILLEARCVPVTSPLGPVRAGFARLRGPICRMKMVNTAVRSKSTALLGSNGTQKLVRCFFAFDDKRDAIRQSELDAARPPLVTGATEPDRDHDLLFALGVVIAENTRGECRAECLILRVAETAGQFRRVGFMHCYNEEADDNPSALLLEALDTMDIPDGLYQEAHSEEATFDITVV